MERLWTEEKSDANPDHRRLTSLTSDVPHGDTSPGRCLFSSAPSSPRPRITQSPSTLSCVTQIFIETHLNVPV